VPAAERLGHLFKLGGFERRKRDLSDISAIVQTIGKASGVVVKEHPISGRTKYATAHDLRRSFGYRWSSRLPVADLRQLCRHRNVSTTLDYYALASSDELAKKVWKEVA
jgi:integrase